jgi:hypothetical protein
LLLLLLPPPPPLVVKLELQQRHVGAEHSVRDAAARSGADASCGRAGAPLLLKTSTTKVLKV